MIISKIGDDTCDSVLNEIYNLGVYRSRNCRVMPGDVVIDAGAHYGLFAIYAIEQGAEKVYSFEPNGQIFDLLIANTSGMNCKCINAALWDSESTIGFREHAPKTAGSRVVLPGLRSRPRDVTVKTVSIDSLALDKVDLIKMDIEGSELQALIGAERTIKRCRPRLMISLYHHRGDPVRLPSLIESYGLDYKFEKSTAPGKHVTGFWY